MVLPKFIALPQRSFPTELILSSEIRRKSVSDIDRIKNILDSIA